MNKDICLFGLRKITFVRHGEAEKFAQDSHIHHSQPPLTQVGTHQAKNLGEHLSKMYANGFDVYACSEFLRTRQTAANMGLNNAQWIVDTHLVEGSRGCIDNPESNHDPEISKLYRGPTGWWEQLPMIERKIDVAIRAELALRRLADISPGGHALVVAHAAMIWRLRMRIEGWSISKYNEKTSTKQEQIGNCDMLEYEIRAGNGSYFKHSRYLSEHKAYIGEWERCTISTVSNSELLKLK